MGRRGDNAPIGQTCPLIDETISQVHNWYMDSEEISKNEYQGFEQRMEKIREANSTLREWGNEQCKLAEEYEKDLDYWKDQAETLTQEIKDLQSDIRTLEKELSEAERQ
jgi:chromosome segregation ATPase